MDEKRTLTVEAARAALTEAEMRYGELYDNPGSFGGRERAHRVAVLRTAQEVLIDAARAETLQALKNAEDWARAETSGVYAAPPKRYAESVLAAFARLRAPRSL